MELGLPEGEKRLSQEKAKEKYFMGPRPERVFVEENLPYGFAAGDCVPGKVNPLLPLSITASVKLHTHECVCHEAV